MADTFSSQRILFVAFLSNPGAVTGLVLPTVIGAFVAHGLTLATATRLGAIEMFASAVLLLVAPLLVNRVNRRWLAVAALLLAAIGQIMSALPASGAAAAVWRVCSGAGSGLIYAVAIASLSATPSPSRSMGFSVAFNQVSAIFLLLVIPLLARSAPGTAAFFVLAAFALFHLAFVPAVPVHVEPAPIAPGAANRLVVLGALGAMFLIAAGFGSTWPIVGLIGAEHGLAPQRIATGLLLGGIGAALGAVVATILATHVNRVVAVVIGTLALAGCMLLALTPQLVLAMFLMMACWAFTLPFYMSLLATIDPTGRLAVLTSAMIPLGVAGGQGLASLFAGTGLDTVVWIGAAIAVAALVTLLASTFSGGIGTARALAA